MNISTNFPFLRELLSQGYIEFLSQVSASVLLLWDILITYDQEVELIWRSPSSIVKYLFIFIRYGGLSQAIITLALPFGDLKTNHNICKAYIWFDASSSLVLLYAVDILLVYRAFAFYGRNRKVLIGLFLMWALDGAATLIIVVLLGLKLTVSHPTPSFLSGLTGDCVLTGFPQLFHDLWISELIFQGFMFLLVLGRSIQMVAATPWKNAMGISNLYFVFIRDGIWAFFLLFGIYVTSAAQTSVFGISFIQWALSLTVIVGSRLILNLKRLGASHANVIMTNSKPIGMEIFFNNTLCVPEVVLSEHAENVLELQRMSRSEGLEG